MKTNDDGRIVHQLTAHQGSGYAKPIAIRPPPEFLAEYKRDGRLMTVRVVMSRGCLALPGAVNYRQTHLTQNTDGTVNDSAPRTRVRT
jgi:hypothetical protein